MYAAPVNINLSFKSMVTTGLDNLHLLIKSLLLQRVHNLNIFCSDLFRMQWFNKNPCIVARSLHFSQRKCRDIARNAGITFLEAGAHVLNAWVELGRGLLLFLRIAWFTDLFSNLLHSVCDTTVGNSNDFIIFQKM